MPTLTRIPPLHSGDCLTLEEFELRYEAMPGVKAELIEGEVFMASPVSWDHADPHHDIVTWSGIYSKYHTPSVGAMIEVSMVLDDRNEYQPDVVMFLRPEFGGNVERNSKKYLEGSPELVIEVSASSASIDLGKKLKVYQRNGIQEYIVWRVYEEQIDWFINVNGQFKLLTADEGVLKSKVFPGLWLDPVAMIGQDYTRVNAVLTEGVQSPEHAGFNAIMATRRK